MHGWDDDQDELDDVLGGMTAEALLDARRRSGGDVGKGIDLWMEETGQKPESIRMLLRMREWSRDSLRRDRPKAGLALIHLLPGGEMKLPGLARRLGNILGLIEKEICPDEELMLYLLGKAGVAIANAAEVAFSDSRSLLRLLNDCRYKIEGGDVVVAPGGRIELDAVLSTFNGDGIGLWFFRLGLQGDLTEFDTAVSARWSDLSGAIADGAVALFRNGASPAPSNYLDAFPGAYGDGDLLERILDELFWRENLTDGFRGGPDAAEWLKALAKFNGWSPKLIRKLVVLEDLLRKDSTHMLAAIRAAVACLWSSSRPEAVYGALTLLRHARLLREWRRQLVDAEEERACIGFVQCLPDTEEVLAVRDEWESLPLVAGGSPRAWAFLSDRAKGHWRAKVSLRLKGKPEAEKGIVEFALAWAPKDVYADLEPMVIALVADADADAHLDEIAVTGKGVSNLRAGALLQHLRLGQPS